MLEQLLLTCGQINTLIFLIIYSKCNKVSSVQVKTLLIPYVVFILTDYRQSSRQAGGIGGLGQTNRASFMPSDMDSGQNEILERDVVSSQGQITPVFHLDFQVYALKSWSDDFISLIHFPTGTNISD